MTTWRAAPTPPPVDYVIHRSRPPVAVIVFGVRSDAFAIEVNGQDLFHHPVHPIVNDHFQVPPHVDPVFCRRAEHVAVWRQPEFTVCNASSADLKRLSCVIPTFSPTTQPLPQKTPPHHLKN